MKLKTPKYEKSDIKIVICNAAKVIGWETRVERAMKTLSNKQDVFYATSIKDNDITVQYWLDDEVQTNRDKLYFISKTFHEINVEFTPIHCDSSLYLKDLSNIFSSIREEHYNNKVAFATHLLRKKKFCDCAKLLATILIYLPTWTIKKLLLNH